MKKGAHRLELTREQHNLPINQVSKYAVKVIKRLKQAGFEAYLVGGGVRDLLLGKSPKDFDVSTNATPEQIRKLISNSRIIGRRFKIVHVIYGDDIIEVTTFRRNNNNVLQVNSAISGQGKRFEVQANAEGMLVRDNSYSKRIQDDAERRDFTINAIYLDIQTGSLIDFHGGLYDLTQGVIDIIGDPETRYREDPVRMLRAARFSAKLGFKISKRTLEKIGPCTDLLQNVSQSRMYDEVNKLFLTGHAQASFHVLNSLGLIEHLFAIDSMLLKSSACFDFLDYAFHSTDIRYSENKRNMPHFLYAIVLWHDFIWNFYKCRETLLTSVYDVNYKDIITEIAYSVLNAQFQKTALPDLVVVSITSLWRIQFLLESKNPEKYVKETTSYSSFRAAFDLFKLRAHFDKNLQDHVVFWDTYYQECKAKAEQRKAFKEIRRRQRDDRDSKRRQGKLTKRTARAERSERSERSERNERSDRNYKQEFDNSSALKQDSNAGMRQEEMDKARAWRESMNLKP